MRAFARALCLLSGGLLAMLAGIRIAGAAELLTPPQVWAGYDPDQGDFKEELVLQETKAGVLCRDSYISAYVLGEEIRVYCQGAGTEQLNDPKWQAPPGGQLGFKFYCTEPQRLILTAAHYNEGEVAITASDDWQEMVVPAGRLVNRFNQQPMKDWSSVGIIHFKPVPGSDMTKVIFAEFKWVVGGKK